MYKQVIMASPHALPTLLQATPARSADEPPPAWMAGPTRASRLGNPNATRLSVPLSSERQAKLPSDPSTHYRSETRFRRPPGAAPPLAPAPGANA